MAIVEIVTTITRRSLMNKSKSDLVDMVLQYADFNGQLHEETKRLNELLDGEELENRRAGSLEAERDRLRPVVEWVAQRECCCYLVLEKDGKCDPCRARAALGKE